MEAMKKQAERFGARCLSEDVVEVGLDGRPFTVRSDRGEYTCKSLIIATGASARFHGSSERAAFHGEGRVGLRHL